MDVFVARQAIFDRASHLYAYELLFRSNDHVNGFDGTEAASATTQVIANSLLSIGLDNILCGKLAFLNFDRSLLLRGLHAILPHESVVLEILETVEPDAEVVAACREFRKQGYTIALDDFVGHPHFEPLTEIAHVIKVDMRNTARAEQERLLHRYRPRGITMLAEKVETHEEFEWARQAGYDLFQGYFFARPALVRGKQIPAAKFNCLRLLREMQHADLDFDRIQKIIREDVSLCYKLARYVNSALFTHHGKVDSIGNSLAFLGESRIRHWAALSALPELAKDKPGELVTHSLVRANFCEELTRLAGAGETHLGFLIGLFSLLDALLDMPLEQALDRAGVSAAVSDALLDSAPENDLHARIYGLVCRYEEGDWKAVGVLASKLGLKTHDLGKAYSHSTQAAHQALRATARTAEGRRDIRHRADGAIQIRWKDRSGREKASTARLINVSTTGLQLQVPDNIPVHAFVSCSDPETGIEGTGSVRYCNPSRGKYLVGLGFRDGTIWREPS